MSSPCSLTTTALLPPVPQCRQGVDTMGVWLLGCQQVVNDSTRIEPCLATIHLSTFTRLHERHLKAGDWLRTSLCDANSALGGAAHRDKHHWVPFSHAHADGFSLGSSVLTGTGGPTLMAVIMSPFLHLWQNNVLAHSVLAEGTGWSHAQSFFLVC